MGSVPEGGWGGGGAGLGGEEVGRGGGGSGGWGGVGVGGGGGGGEGREGGVGGVWGGGGWGVGPGRVGAGVKVRPSPGSGGGRIASRPGVWWFSCSRCPSALRISRDHSGEWIRPFASRSVRDPRFARGIDQPEFRGPRGRRLRKAGGVVGSSLPTRAAPKTPLWERRPGRLSFRSEAASRAFVGDDLPQFGRELQDLCTPSGASRATSRRRRGSRPLPNALP